MKIFSTILILSTLLSSSAIPVSAQTVGAQTPTTEQTYNIFMLVKTTNDWLALSPEARFAFLSSDIQPILQAHPTVEMSFFDTEGFNSRVTCSIAITSAEEWQCTSAPLSKKIPARRKQGRKR